MSFWDQLKQKLGVFFSKIGLAARQFMNGRYGPDQLSLHMLILGIVFYVISVLTGAFWLSLISSVLYIFTAWRMLSRNTAKRAAENSRYTGFYNTARQKIRQWWMRMKNRREYKYFHCPNCHAILRLKRGSGTMHVTCGKCKHQFEQKA